MRRVSRLGRGLRVPRDQPKPEALRHPSARQVPGIATDDRVRPRVARNQLLQQQPYGLGHEPATGGIPPDPVADLDPIGFGEGNPSGGRTAEQVEPAKEGVRLALDDRAPVPDPGRRILVESGEAPFQRRYWLELRNRCGDPSGEMRLVVSKDAM